MIGDCQLGDIVLDDVWGGVENAVRNAVGDVVQSIVWDAVQDAAWGSVGDAVEGAVGETLWIVGRGRDD